jgi:hypothetical protein
MSPKSSPRCSIVATGSSTSRNRSVGAILSVLLGCRSMARRQPQRSLINRITRLYEVQLSFAELARFSPDKGNALTSVSTNTLILLRPKRIPHLVCNETFQTCHVPPFRLSILGERLCLSEPTAAKTALSWPLDACGCRTTQLDKGGKQHKSTTQHAKLWRVCL